MRKIVSKPEIMFGEPCIEGTRVTASVVYGSWVAGDTLETLANSYGVKVEDIWEAILYEQERLFKAMKQRETV